MRILFLIRSDYKKYKAYGGHFVSIVFFTQAFWASFQYRVAHGCYLLKVPVLKPILLGVCLIWQKIIEILTGISIPYSVTIGNSFYIGHFGGIIINAKVIIGDNCNISQGVTLGVSGRGENRGVPTIGNNVYIGVNGVIVGAITIGDNCVIAANTLVTKSIEANGVVVGVPGEIINYSSSKDYI